MTNTLLIFFALPIATILISIALQKLLRSPILVAAVIFAIFLIVAFAAFDETFLVATIIYTIIAYITAFLTCIISKIINKICNCNNSLNTTNSLDNNNAVENEISTIDSFSNSANSNNNCNCNCNNSNNTQNVLFNARITPNNSTNGRTGSFNGYYRRCR